MSARLTGPPPSHLCLTSLRCRGWRPTLGLVPVRLFGRLDAPQLTSVGTFPTLAAHCPHDCLGFSRLSLNWGFCDCFNASYRFGYMFLASCCTSTLMHFIIITEVAKRWSFTLDAMFLLYEFHDSFRLLRRNHEVIHISANVLIVDFALGQSDPHIFVVSGGFESVGT